MFICLPISVLTHLNVLILPCDLCMLSRFIMACSVLKIKCNIYSLLTRVLKRILLDYNLSIDSRKDGEKVPSDGNFSKRKHCSEKGAFCTLFTKNALNYFVSNLLEFVIFSEINRIGTGSIGNVKKIRQVHQKGLK